MNKETHNIFSCIYVSPQDLQLCVKADIMNTSNMKFQQLIKASPDVMNTCFVATADVQMYYPEHSLLYLLVQPVCWVVMCVCVFVLTVYALDRQIFVGSMYTQDTESDYCTHSLQSFVVDYMYCLSPDVRIWVPMRDVTDILFPKHHLPNIYLTCQVKANGIVCVLFLVCTLRKGKIEYICAYYGKSLSFVYIRDGFCLCIWGLNLFYI